MSNFFDDEAIEMMPRRYNPLDKPLAKEMPRRANPLNQPLLAAAAPTPLNPPNKFKKVTPKVIVADPDDLGAGSLPWGQNESFPPVVSKALAMGNASFPLPSGRDQSDVAALPKGPMRSPAPAVAPTHTYAASSDAKPADPRRNRATTVVTPAAVPAKVNLPPPLKTQATLPPIPKPRLTSRKIDVDLDEL